MPVSPPPQSSPFAAIAAAVRERLAAALGVSTAYIRLVANDKYPVSQTEPVQVFVQVFGIGEPRDPGLSFENAGAGNLARPVGRRLRCYLYLRTSEDVEGGDEVALLGRDATQSAGSAAVLEAPGQLAYEEAVAAALSDWMPLSGAGVGLTLTPIHLLDSASGPPIRQPENDSGLVRSVLDFEAVYSLSIRSNEPNY